jgi:hypothetical protein
VKGACDFKVAEDVDTVVSSLPQVNCEIKVRHQQLQVRVLHGTATQKTTINIHIAVKTSNPTGSD